MDALSTALELIGVALIIAAAATITPTASLAVAGIAAITIGALIEHNHNTSRD